MRITGTIRHGGRAYRKGDEAAFAKVMKDIDPDRLKFLETQGALKLSKSAKPADVDGDDDEDEDGDDTDGAGQGSGGTVTSQSAPPTGKPAKPDKPAKPARKRK